MAAVAVSAPPLALPEGFSLLPDRSASVSRHWFDTFDRRLFLAGLELYVEAEAGRARIVAGPLGSPTASVPWDGPARRPPDVLRPGDLPPSVRAIVEKPSRPRALVHLVTARVRRDDHRVVDNEGKTVCRLAVETAVAAGADSVVRAVSTAGLRGYEHETELVASAVVAGDDALLPAVLRSIGAAEAPGSGAPGRDLSPGLPASAGLASIVGHLLETVAANVPGTLARHDTEFLHDLRVAVRRGRTALKLALDVVAEDPRSRLAAELKWLGDVTTPARDLDVHVEGFPRLEATAVSPDLRDATAPFTALLAERDEAAHHDLEAALRSARFRRLQAGTPALLGALEDGASPLTTAVLARRRLDETFRRVITRGRRVDASSPDQAVHDLRKRAKELRYTIEFFSGLLPADDAAQVVKDLKGMQDVLGDFNDTVVQRALLLESAEAVAAGGASARAVLVLGEMRRELARSGQQAREEVKGRFAHLRRWRTDGRWDRMLASLA